MSGQVCKDLIFVIVIFQNTRGASEALIGGLVTSKFSTITTVYLELMMLCSNERKKGNFASRAPNWVQSLDGNDELMGSQRSTFPKQ